MLAAACGDVAAVAETLSGATTLDVHVRLPCARSSTRATTALHAASSAGAVEVVRLLLHERADVMGRHGHFRGLTPLHDAANVEVAAALLDAGASPIPLDPREPDPIWYHEQRNRVRTAALIRERRGEVERQQREARVRLHPPTVQETFASQSPRRPLCSPPLSSSELALVRSECLVDGDVVLSMLLHSQTETEPGVVHREDVECSICMNDLRSSDNVLLLPCGNNRIMTADRGMSDEFHGRPHAFHSDCLERWLLTKSGACPICRTSLRGPLHPAGRRTSAVSASPSRKRNSQGVRPLIAAQLAACWRRSSAAPASVQLTPTHAALEARERTESSLPTRGRPAVATLQVQFPSQQS